MCVWRRGLSSRPRARLWENEQLLDLMTGEEEAKKINDYI
jgi:hypothetical protein